MVHIKIVVFECSKLWLFRFGKGREGRSKLKGERKREDGKLLN
jgi:hypothetical protein